jgi:hypothetical protein
MRNEFFATHVSKVAKLDRSAIANDDKQALAGSVVVSAPAGFTLAFVATYFSHKKSGVGALPLKVPLRTPAGDLALEKTVSIDVRYVPSGGEPHALSVSWSPNGTTTVPSFGGTMTTKALSDSTCRLMLGGTYSPPGGLAGRAFDAIVGHRIAECTLEDLLERLGESAAAEYQIRMTM